MTVISSATAVSEPAVSVDSADRPRPDSSRSLRVLAVVDGSERTNRVVDYLDSLARRSEGIEVVILSVLEKSGEGRLRGYQTFKQSEIDDRLISDLGLPIVNSVSRRLDKFGIHSLTRIRIGDPVQTILDCAADEGCAAVVIGDVGTKRLQRWLIRVARLAATSSVAVRVAMLAEIPVVLVK
jgi:nucleotide-binding universal stress UspA family protein